jgi:hypothetical protein
MPAKSKINFPIAMGIKPRSRPSPALSFILSIESTWKGQEAFAMWLIQKIKPKTVVDLGFHRGLSTIVFAYKNSGHVFGIDWFEEGSYAEKSIILEKAFQNISDAIRFNYVKNIHLIIGPFHDVSRTWTRSIDLLHIDLASSYSAAKFHYDNWKRYLKKGAVILIHDINRYPTEVGRFFNELPLPKVLLPTAGGLGVVTTDEALIKAIRAEWLK